MANRSDTRSPIGDQLTQGPASNLGGRTIPLTVHVCGADTLISWAQRSTVPRDLVLTQEKLQRRNLKRVFSEAAQPRSNFRFATPVDIGIEIETARPTWRRLDRPDRIRLVKEILTDPDVDQEQLRTAFGTNLHARTEAVENTREELDVIAGGVDARHDVLDAVVDRLPAPSARQTRALLDGIQTVNRTLRERTDCYVAADPVFRAACDAIASTDGTAWDQAFPTIDRLALAGVSTLGASILELLAHVATFTEVDVHLFLRAETGPRIVDRLGARLTAGGAQAASVRVGADASAGMARTVPVVELVATTRRQEARVAMAVVDALLERGVAVSDIAVVARDADRYEHALDQAAGTYGRQLTVWTQLALSRTLPYQLLVRTADLLAATAAQEVKPETLFAPLDCQWVPPGTNPSSAWPLDYRAVAAARRTIDDESARPLDAWLEPLDAVAAGGGSGLRGLIEWALQQPTAPRPRTVEATLRPVLEAYDTVVLPQRFEADTADLSATSRTAWAVERLRTLLPAVRQKFADWRARDHVTDSWAAVSDIMDALATSRPGRREHDNAECIDVLEGTDTWLRRYPYVIAVGLVDGEWPERPTGALPPAFRDAVIEGSGIASSLGIRGAWTEARDADHFADTLRTPSKGLILTRFTEDVDGVSYRRSPLLDGLETDPTVVAGGEIKDLLAVDRQLPEPLRRMVPRDVTVEVDAGAGP